MRKNGLRRLFGLMLSTAMFFSVGMPSFAADTSGCRSSIWASVYPDECIIDIHDNAQVIAGHAITEKLDTCDDTFAGIVLSTGYDGIGWIKIKSAKPTGELTATSVGFELWLVQQCLSWTDAYSVQFELISPDGTVIPATISENSFTYRKQYSGSISSYCFSNICGDTRYQGSFDLSQTPISGSYKIRLRIKSNWELSKVDKTFSYSNQLFYGIPTTQKPDTATDSGLVNDGEASICGGDLKETLKPIKGYEKKIHSAHKKLIKSAINSPKEICGIDLPVKQVVCQGIYFGGTANAKLAKAKATLVCNYAKTIQKTIKTVVKIKATKSKSYNGTVYATFIFN